MVTRLQWAGRQRASSKCRSWFGVARMPSIDKPADCAPVHCTVAGEPEPRSETTPIAEESVGLPLPPSDEPRAPSTDEPPATTSDLQKRAESEDVVGAPPPLLPVIEIDDLDWPALCHLIKAGGIRARIQNTVCEMDTLLARPGGPKMLFDGYRSSPTDRAILIADVGEAPLWIVGDLHGDLLALEGALALVR